MDDYAPVYLREWNRSKIAQDLLYRARYCESGVEAHVIYEPPYTTAVLYCSPVLAGCYLHLSIASYDNGKITMAPPDGLNPIMVFGLAMQGKGDEWDPDVGKNIALKRAARKLADMLASAEDVANIIMNTIFELE